MQHQRSCASQSFSTPHRNKCISASSTGSTSSCGAQSSRSAISSKILAGEPGIVEKYKQFLSGGCSMDPIDLLKICGVDMTKPEPVEEALDVFASYVEELEKLTAEA